MIQARINYILWKLCLHQHMQWLFKVLISGFIFKLFFLQRKYREIEKHHTNAMIILTIV